MRNFREHYLPIDTAYESLDDVPDDVQEILDIYEGIKGCLSVNTVKRVNDLLLEEFAEQQCFVVEETEEDEVVILAVANYREDLARSLGYIEGIAVEHQTRNRKIGSYMLDNIVEVARVSGLSEVRLSSVRRAIPFYQRNGFSMVNGDKAEIYPVMARPL